MTNTSISSLGIMMVVGLSVFLGMNTVLMDMESARYNVTSFTSANDTARDILSDIEKNTTIDIQDSLTGDQGWLQTTFNIFFRLPSAVVGSLSAMSNSAGKLMGMVAGEEGYIPMPGWITTMLAVVIGIIVITTLVYLVLGRRP